MSFEPVLWLMLGRAIGQASAIAVPIVLARLLDQTSFGTYKQLFLVYATVHAIAQLGLAESLYYFLPRAREDIGRYLANALFGLVLSALASGLLLMALPVNLWLQNPSLGSLMPLLICFVACMLPSTVLEIELLAREQARAASVAYAVSDVLRAGAMLAAALLVPQSLRAVLFGLVAFGVVRLCVTFWYLRHRYKGTLAFDRALLTRQLAYALPFALAVLIETAQQYLHQYVVSYRFDAATFAVYAVACFQVPLVDYTTNAASNVLMVRMSNALHDGSPENALACFHATTRQLALLLCFTVACVAVSAKDIVLVLFTQRYLASVPLLQLFCLGVLLMSLQTDGVLRVYAQTRFLVVLNSVRLLLVLVFIGPLIDAWGLGGAIGVTLLSSIAAKTLALDRIRRLTRVSWSGVLPWRELGIAVFAALVAAGVAQFIDVVAHPFALIVLRSFLLALVYLFLVTALGLLPAPWRLLAARTSS